MNVCGAVGDGNVVGRAWRVGPSVVIARVRDAHVHSCVGARVPLRLGEAHVARITGVVAMRVIDRRVAAPSIRTYVQRIVERGIARFRRAGCGKNA